METKPSVLILEKGTDGFINYGADSLAGDMVNQIGGTLAQEESRVLTAEEVAEANRMYCLLPILHIWMMMKN